MKKASASLDNLYRLDGRVPVAKAIPFGLQHVLAMFVSNLVPVLIVMAAALVEGGRHFTDVEISGILQCAMLASGIGTVIQLYPIWRIGAKLPIVMGCSFTFLAAMLGIATTYGYETLVGAVIAGGIFEGTLGLTAKYWRKYLDPIVPACVVMAIGLSLLSVGMDSFGGGNGAGDFGAWYNLMVALISLVACMVYKAVVKGVWKNLDVLFGLGVGYGVALIFTLTGIAPMIDFGTFTKTIDQLGFFNVPLPVFLKGTMPVFKLGPILSMCIVFLVSAAETIGGTAAVASDGLGREATDREIAGSLGVDGYGSALSGIFGCCPITSFNQNIGLIATTGIVNRFTVLMGALILILASFLPPIGAFFNTIPDAVLGGCMVMLYGSIIYSGVKMIAACCNSQRNMTIVALSFCVGVGVTQVSPGFFAGMPPVIGEIFAGNAVAGVFVLSLVLSLVLPKKMGEDD